MPTPTTAAITAALLAAGIPAHQPVVAHRDGSFSVKFAAADPNDFESRGIAPARWWARRILRALPDARIAGTFDGRADWRPNRPILYATVKLRFETQKAQAVAQAS